jgi:S1-C subfamily serine protease
MNDDELLPKDEPGAPLVRVNPGFADKVMRRVEQLDRQQSRAGLGMSLFVVLAVAVIAAAVVHNYAGRTPSDENIPKPQYANVPHMEPSPGGGVVVKSIDAKSPLAEAGVREGDVVKSIDNRPVNDAALAAALLRAKDNCKTTQFVVVRGSGTRTVTTPPLNAAPCRSQGVTPR